MVSNAFHEYVDLDEGPPENSMDWNWFKPVNTGDNANMGNSLWHIYHPQCHNCDVYGRAAGEGRPRCWCCGRFIKGPEQKLPAQSRHW